MPFHAPHEQENRCWRGEQVPLVETDDLAESLEELGLKVPMIESLVVAAPPSVTVTILDDAITGERESWEPALGHRDLVSLEAIMAADVSAIHLACPHALKLLRDGQICTIDLVAFERRGAVLGCERLTGATLDRLTHRCHVLEANGQSYRLKDATRRRKRQ